MTIDMKMKEHITEACRFRHACKQFDPDRKISQADFAFIMETARLSPSSFGLEPWKFIVLQNPALREKLLPITWGGQRQIPTASHFVLVLARTAKSMHPDSAYIERVITEEKKLSAEAVAGFKQRYRNFLQAEFALIDNERAMFEWSCRQTYIALGNMMSAAAQIGIDSCPIEGFDKQKAEEILAEEGLFDREEFGLSCMVAFGYRTEPPRPKKRQAPEQIIEWIE